MINLIIIIALVDLLEEKESHGDNSILFVIFFENIVVILRAKLIICSLFEFGAHSSR